MSADKWTIYQNAYEALRREGLSHDAAADKALYLMTRGRLPEKPNWRLIARRCQLNEARLADNSRCVSLYEPIGWDDNGQEVTWADILPAPQDSDPGAVILAREELSRIPPHIIQLFIDRAGPLTGTEAARISRFRKASARIQAG